MELDNGFNSQLKSSTRAGESRNTLIEGHRFGAVLIYSVAYPKLTIAIQTPANDATVMQ